MLRIAVAVISGSIAGACGNPAVEQPVAASAAARGETRTVAVLRCVGPVVMTLHRDVSKSTTGTGTPDLTEADVRVLVEQVLLVCGGELAYGEIGRDSFRPFERLRVAEPPAAPHAPSFDDNPFIRGEQEERFDVTRRKWELKRASWLADVEADIQRFFTRVRPKLLRAPDDGTTDVEGAVARALVLFGENDTTWSVPPRRLMLLVTDGIDTAKRRAVGGLPPDVTMIVAGVPGVLSRFTPLQYESVAAAVREMRRQLLKEEP